jgi:hypothetical protein
MKSFTQWKAKKEFYEAIDTATPDMGQSSPIGGTAVPAPMTGSNPVAQPMNGEVDQQETQMKRQSDMFFNRFLGSLKNIKNVSLQKRIAQEVVLRVTQEFGLTQQEIMQVLTKVKQNI